MASSVSLSPSSLDRHPLAAAPVEFRVEDLLPRAQIRAPVAHRHDQLASHDAQLCELRSASGPRRRPCPSWTGVLSRTDMSTPATLSARTRSSSNPKRESRITRSLCSSSSERYSFTTINGSTTLTAAQVGILATGPDRSVDRACGGIRTEMWCVVQI